MSTAVRPSADQITGVILAGGRAQRLGGSDKGLLPLAGRPLVAWVIEALTPQVAGLLISANRNLDAYRRFGYPLVSDSLEGFQGPLAGILSAMDAAPTPWLLTAPCDGPFLAPDLGARLVQALVQAGASLALASDGVRSQPLFALLPVSLAADLRAYLAAGHREVGRWMARHRAAVAEFGDRPHAFANLNAPEDRVQLEEVLGGA